MTNFQRALAEQLSTPEFLDVTDSVIATMIDKAMEAKNTKRVISLGKLQEMAARAREQKF